MNAWSQSLFGLPWGRVLDIVQAVDAEAATKLRFEAVPELAHHGEVGNGRRIDDVKSTQGGNSSEYLAARLKRDHPEIAEAVTRGEHKSIRAAAREAGIVKPADPYKQVCKRTVDPAS